MKLTHHTPHCIAVNDNCPAEICVCPHHLGKNQSHALAFACRYVGWHTYGRDRATVQAILSLARHGLVEISNVSRQFRVTSFPGFRPPVSGTRDQCDGRYTAAGFGPVVRK